MHGMIRNIIDIIHSDKTFSGMESCQYSLDAAFLFSIDQFSIFDEFLLIKGWAFHFEFQTRGFYLVSDGGRRISLEKIPMESQDVMAVHGPAARGSRFVIRHIFQPGERPARTASLLVTLSDGSVQSIPLGAPAVDPARALFETFHERVDAMPPGNFLEIGFRARCGNIRRERIPPTWSYTGLDVVAGETVDLVGDADGLSNMLAPAGFNAVLAISVLEHVSMPWKLVLELNKVMATGGIGFVLTHQNWPLHDRPWDFWRFSSDVWPALFNRRTGFRILAAEMAEPAFTVANRWHPGVDFHDGGFLASAVMFEKIGESDLDWQVDPGEILRSEYPA